MHQHHTTQPSASSIEIKLLFQQSTLQVLHLKQPRPLFIGDALGCDFFVPGLPRTPLLMLDDRGPALCLAPTARGYVVSGGQRQPLSRVGPAFFSRVGPAFLMEPGARYVLELGALALQLRRVEGAQPITAKPKRDRGIWSYTAASALFHSILLVLLFQVAPELRSLDLSLLAQDNLLVKFQLAPSEEKPEEIPTWLSEKARDGLLGDQEGMMHQGPSGAMGKKLAKQQQGLYQIQGKEPHLAKQRAQEMVSHIGIVGLIKGGASEASPFVSVFGKETMAGVNQRDLLGGFLGDRPDEAEGGYGLGLRGAGVGGSYKGEGTLGAGALGFWGGGAGGTCDDTCEGGLLGRGSGSGSGVESKIEIKKEREHKASAPEVIEGKVIVDGGLDKDVIRRVIRRAMPGIKYCYEQGLLQNKSLAGKVTVSFVIAANGAVVSAAPTSGILAEVDQCVARKISQLAFPAPSGVVAVSYPFVFQAK